ncbi:BGBP-like protein, partial [Mya arenaria]
MSGKLKSKKTVTFGEVCVRARIPQGDWIWPASDGGHDHGRNQIGSTMHWGTDPGHNRFMLTHGDRDDHTFSSQMHTYCVDWTHEYIAISVDNHQFYLILNVAIAGTNGFFPDNWTYNSRKPWGNNSPTEYADFWRGRKDWLRSWEGDKVAMEID